MLPPGCVCCSRDEFDYPVDTVLYAPLRACPHALDARSVLRDELLRLTLGLLRGRGPQHLLLLPPQPPRLIKGALRRGVRLRDQRLPLRACRSLELLGIPLGASDPFNGFSYHRVLHRAVVPGPPTVRPSRPTLLHCLSTVGRSAGPSPLMCSTTRSNLAPHAHLADSPRQWQVRNLVDNPISAWSLGMSNLL